MIVITHIRGDKAGFAPPATARVFVSISRTIQHFLLLIESRRILRTGRQALSAVDFGSNIILFYHHYVPKYGEHVYNNMKYKNPYIEGQSGTWQYGTSLHGSKQQ